MNKILSSHHILASPESQQFVADFYDLVLRHRLVADQALKDAIEFSLTHYAKFKLLPTLDALGQETGFEPSEQPFSDEKEALYAVAVLAARCETAHLRKSLREAVNIEPRDEMLRTVLKLCESLSVAGGEREPPGLGDIIDGVITQNRSVAQEGAKTGIPNLDRVTGPIRKGSMETVGGAPSHGKSLFADNFLYTNSILGTMRTLYLSLEVPKDIVAARLLSRHSYQLLGEQDAIPYKDILEGKANQGQLRQLAESLNDKLQKVTLLDASDTIPFYPPTDFGAFLERQFAKAPFDILILDYLQILKSYCQLDGYEYQFMNKIVSILRRKTVSIGGDNRIVSLILSQVNRESYNYVSKLDRKGKPKEGYTLLSSIAECNELERSSQLIVFLYLDGTLRTGNEIKFQLLKNRDGELIESPDVTFMDPRYCVIGETAVYNNVFSPESLADLDQADDFLGTSSEIVF